MLKTFNDYILDLTVTPQTLLLPEDAQIVALREASDKLIMTALIDANETYGKIRAFQICTLSNVILANEVIYIGTCETELLGQIYLVEIK